MKYRICIRASHYMYDFIAFNDKLKPELQGKVGKSEEYEYDENRGGSFVLGGCIIIGLQKSQW